MARVWPQNHKKKKSSQIKIENMLSALHPDIMFRRPVTFLSHVRRFLVDSSWNVMTHSDRREGKWRGNGRMEWVSSSLHTTSEHGVSNITTVDAHTSAAISRLNFRPSADLNGLVRSAERRNLFTARVPSHFNWPLSKLRYELLRNITMFSEFGLWSPDSFPLQPQDAVPVPFRRKCGVQWFDNTHVSYGI